MIGNPFNDPAFEMAALTRSMNVVPRQYGRITELGVFTDAPIAVRTALVEYNNGVLNLLPTKPLGAPGTLGTKGSRTVRSFPVPHIPHDDVVLPEEVQGIRAFGSDSALETVARVLNAKLLAMSNKHDITHEHLRAGALNGIVLDADGTTILNLFTEFSVTRKTVNWDFTGTVDVRARCAEVLDHIDDNLLGETMSGVRGICAPEWFDAFVAEADVAAAWDRWQDGSWLRQDPRSAFEFAGIKWERYTGKATDGAGVVRKFVPASKVVFYPEGTQTTFVNVIAPADFNETVNTLGLAKYAKQEPRKFDRGTDLHTQSNILPLCTRPALLVEGTLT